MKQLASLVFFGSGPVGAASLSALDGAGFEIEAVITKPKPAHHRGEFPVLELADKLSLKTFTPKNKDELVKLFQKNEFYSPLGLVVDYGFIIPRSVIRQFPLGIINSHFSLLPQWRGADPISFAILSGQQLTGVSIMKIDSGLDTGSLLAQADYKMEPGENVQTLTEHLIDLSNQTLAKVLPLYIKGELVPVPQDGAQKPSFSRRLTKADGIIDWGKPAEVIEREVRAYLGWPKSQAKIFGHDVIITKARLAAGLNDGALVMKCKPGYLEIEELTAPSGRKMSGADFTRGYKKPGSS